MSQETPLSSLGGNKMNPEDSRLVDSILNDLNSSKPPSQGMGNPSMGNPSMGNPSMGNSSMGGPQRGQPPQQMTQEQHKAVLAQRQQQMMQQQAMQQQAMQQQQAQQKIQEVDTPTAESLLEKIQSDGKYIIIVVILSILVNISAVDDLFKMEGITYFLQENGSLNIQAIIIKALVVGIVFFLCKNLLPLN